MSSFCTRELAHQPTPADSLFTLCWLQLACLYGHDACVSELLRHGADPSIVNKVDGSTVLHDAAAGGYLDICKTILGRAPGLVKIGM